MARFLAIVETMDSDCRHNHASALWLLQPCPAFFADPPVDISAQVFFAGGAFPVLGGIADIRADNKSLGTKERDFGKGSEEIGSFIDHRTQENGKERRRDRDELTVLAHPELLQDLLGLFFW